VHLLDFPLDGVERISRLLAAIGLEARPLVSFEEAHPYLSLDKKTRGRRVHCALPTAIGSMEEAGGQWSLPVQLDEMKAAWRLASEIGCVA
jgi:3-dehydroquinate synthetase